MREVTEVDIKANSRTASVKILPIMLVKVGLGFFDGERYRRRNAIMGMSLWRVRLGEEDGQGGRRTEDGSRRRKG